MAEDKEETLANILNSFMSTEETLTISQPITPKRETLSRSIDSGAGEITGILNERIQQTVKLSKLEKLYHTDGLTFRMIQEYINGILGSGIYYNTSNKTIENKITKWSDRIGFKFSIEEFIRDIYTFGNCWVEIIYNKDRTDIAKLIIINPKTMDYIRDQKTGDVSLDEYGEFLGYEQVIDSLTKKVRWYKNKIVEEIAGEENNIYNAKDGEDCRDKITHLKLYGAGDSYLGITPLEMAYKTAIIRMNVEDTLGETAFRGGGIIAYLDNAKRLGEEQKNRLISDLKNITSRNIFMLDKTIQLSTMPIPDQKERELVIYALADEQTATMGIPLTLIMKSMSRAYKGEKEEDAVQFELSLIALQERLAYQIRKSILRVWCRLNKVPEEFIPSIKFIPRVPNLELARMRSVASLARWGIIRYDPQLELALRKEMNLPTYFVDNTLKQWKKEKRSVEDTSKKKNVQDEDSKEEVEE